MLEYYPYEKSFYFYILPKVIKVLGGVIDYPIGLIFASCDRGALIAKKKCEALNTKFFCHRYKDINGKYNSTCRHLIRSGIAHLLFMVLFFTKRKNMGIHLKS